MDRITNRHLESLVDRINKSTNNSLTPWNVTPGKQYTANIGSYYIDGAYGGVKLVQMVNTGGGIRDISQQGFGTKRELYNFMRAFLSGMEVKQ